ncbi:hypothetical protein [Rhodococcus ruber]|uniref:hypothetical protein n=1 Tax=Rhodococcus ruber TaxID=1830 RepID=UPI0013779E95|nr:hypothetical protein [Rhodococcus ruber]
MRDAHHRGEPEQRDRIDRYIAGCAWTRNCTRQRCRARSRAIDHILLFPQTDASALGDLVFEGGDGQLAAAPSPVCGADQSGAADGRLTDQKVMPEVDPATAENTPGAGTCGGKNVGFGREPGLVEL